MTLHVFFFVKFLVFITEKNEKHKEMKLHSTTKDPPS